MAGPDKNRDLEALIAETEKHRLQVETTWEKIENLEAAIESAKEAQTKAKSLISKFPSATSARKQSEMNEMNEDKLEPPPKHPESGSTGAAAP